MSKKRSKLLASKVWRCTSLIPLGFGLSCQFGIPRARLLTSMFLFVVRSPVLPNSPGFFLMKQRGLAQRETNRDFKEVLDGLGQFFPYTSRFFGGSTLFVCHSHGYVKSKPEKTWPPPIMKRTNDEKDRPFGIFSAMPMLPSTRIQKALGWGLHAPFLRFIWYNSVTQYIPLPPAFPQPPDTDRLSA